MALALGETLARSKKTKGESEMAVPWGAIISVLPSLVEAAGKLLTKADAPPASVPAIPDSNAEKQIAAVIERLKYFESLKVDQANLLKKTIEELQNVTLKSARTAVRVNIALASSTVAIVLSLIALFAR
jgi:hypothetical protein